ncbi:MAG: hypothetical protein ACREJ2_06370 [Planctomycetota bacterium]
MPYVFRTECDFFRAGATPAVCLFSGRRDKLSPTRVPVRGCCPGERCIVVPAALGEYWRWRSARMWGLLPLILGLAGAALVIYFYHDPADAGFPPLLALGSGVLGALFTALVLPSAGRDRIHFTACRTPGMVEIIFPSRHEHVFWEYQRAYKAWNSTRPQTDAPKVA